MEYCTAPVESILSIPPALGSINKYTLLGESSATFGFLVAVQGGNSLFFGGNSLFFREINWKSMFEPRIPSNAQAASPDAGKK